jgi:transcriptional regulator with XRE-family HTH domain
MATPKVTDKVGELLTGDLGAYLKEQRETARLSLRQLASAAGVSNPYLSQIERGLRRPSAEVLQQIAKGLQLSAEALFMRAGILEESEGLHVEVAIQSDFHLTARQKRVLLDIYTTFRAENARSDAADGADPAGAAEAAAEAEAAEQTAARKAAVKKAAAKQATAEKVAARKAVRTTAAKKAAKQATAKRATRKVVGTAGEPGRPAKATARKRAAAAEPTRNDTT